ncbi:MAG: glycosyltransferase [Chloroflexota bacterium]|nr:glycosyltransferase [Chloroflexota bacterium]
MKILYVADGRSPIAINWMRYFVEQNHEVHLASLYPCRPDLDLASLTNIPVVFSSAVELGASGKGNTGAWVKDISFHPLYGGTPHRLQRNHYQKGNVESWGKMIMRKIATPKIRTWLRHRFVPRSLPKAAQNLQVLISKLQPDLIHAMRIPYEGMLAALASRSPLLVSVWGNDFTLHAPATRSLNRLTRLTLERADALHTDCRRDLNLASEWGFDDNKPSLVVPGAGGIQLDVFFPHPQPLSHWERGVVINPRGMRAYVRNDTFFQAIPRVLEHQPRVQFTCPAMQNQPEAEAWASRLGVGESLKLLPRLTRPQMAASFRQSQIVLSITEHDGTPNSLLEALACGCFPIVGDIPSLREWITPGVNGFLVDPADPKALADAVVAGLQNPELCARARKHNARLIAERAEYGCVMGKAESFYQRLTSAVE